MNPVTTLRDEAATAARLIESMQQWLNGHGDFVLPWDLAHPLAELTATGERLKRAAVEVTAVVPAAAPRQENSRFLPFRVGREDGETLLHLFAMWAARPLCDRPCRSTPLTTTRLDCDFVGEQPAGGECPECHAEILKRKGGAA